MSIENCLLQFHINILSDGGNNISIFLEEYLLQYLYSSLIVDNIVYSENYSQR